MIRRAAVFGLAFVGALWALAGAAAACEREHVGADWACLYVEHLDMGICQQNPLPQDLPTDVPDELQVVPDEAPEVAPIVEGVLPLIPDVKPEVPSIASLVATAGSLVPSPSSLVPGGNPVPQDPTALIPGLPGQPGQPGQPLPLPPYEPTGMPGTPI